jgi:ribonuclease E
MEMSRQRLRTGVLEASTKACPHCEGTGLMRTAASAGLSALRIIEDEAARGRGERILLRAGRDAAVYVLNKKRLELAEIEHRYGVSIEIAIDEGFEGARMTVESSGPRPVPAHPAAPVVESPEEEEEELEAALIGAEAEEEEEEERAETQEERGGRRRRRRRRGGRGRRRGGGQEAGLPADELPPPVEEHAATEMSPEEDVETETEAEDKPKKSRRRRKPRAAAAGEVEPDSSPMVERPADEEPPIAETEAPAEPQPKPKRSRNKKAEAEPEAAAAEAAPVEADEAAAKKPRSRKAKPKEKAVEAAPVPAADNDPNGGEEGGKPRSGWWQRTFG